MRIMLIQPKMNKRPMDTDLKTRMSPSLALYTLLQLTPAGHETVIINENIAPIDFRQTCDLVGITITLDVLPNALEIARQFRARGIPVVAGGIHVTCDSDNCAPFFDALCIGPAERVWAQIVEDASQRRLQRIYCDMAHFQGSEIASPKYNAIDRKRYLYSNVILTGRGCPNRCDFCYNSSENRMYVRRPIQDVLQDIAAIQTNHILFIDDNFIGSPSYTYALLKELAKRKLKWNAAVTTRILDHLELLDLMKETGCQSLFIGLESISPSSLQGVHKDNQVDKYAALVNAIHSRGIMINASMVFGLDGDDPSTFSRTLDWLIEHRIETLTSHILTPYPGTALYRRMEREGRILEHDLSKYNTAHVVFQPRNMTKEELYDGYLWMYRKFYSFRNILRRMPTDKTQRKSFLLFNFMYRKFGRFTSLVTRLIPMNIIGRIAAKLSYR